MADSSSSDAPRLILIDGSGFIFRAYYAIPPLKRQDGTPVNAVFGFSSMLYKLLLDASWTFGQFSHMAVVFDTARQSFRNQIYTEYKAHRPPPPEDLIPQFSLVREATDAFNMPRIEMEDYEADDIIATYAEQVKALGGNVVIVSSDKDFMQLVDDKVVMWDPMKNKTIDRDGVLEKFGVAPELVVDVQALCGDSVDNIPGVMGIGIKTAAQLVTEFGDFETLFSKLDQVKQPKRRQSLIDNKDMAYVSRELVRLRRDVNVPLALDDLAVRAVDYSKLQAFFQEQSFKSLVRKAASEVTTDDQGASAASVSSQKNYELVTTVDALEAWVRTATLAGHVAIDTETTGLDVMAVDLVGISLCVEPGHACYIPVKYTPDEGGLLLVQQQASHQILPLDQVLTILKPLLESPAVMKIGQNIKYDITILARLGIAVTPVDDTMLLSYVLNAGSHTHGMSVLAEKFLGITPIEFSDVAGKGSKQVTFDRVPLDQACAYAGEDADITLRLWQIFKRQLVDARMVSVYETLERPLIGVIAQMEQAGVSLQPMILASLGRSFSQQSHKLEQEIFDLAGETFTIGSPKQLGVILFEKLKIKNGKKNKSGAYKTDVGTLEKLLQDHPLPAKVLEWRSLTKMKTTYTDGLQNKINPHTGRVHTSFGMAIAQTGRLSSSEPNLQNIPIRLPEGRKIRQAFCAPAGCLLMSADYSQIELRILASIADIHVLKKAFDEGADIHSLTASQIFSIPVEHVDAQTRRNAKAINFGIIYGQSSYGLSEQLGIPVREAKLYINSYFDQYPGILDYMEHTKEFCRNNGYVETIFGRKIHLPAINDRNGATRAFTERAAINGRIQGTAADIIKRAMIRMPDALAQAHLKAKMILQVHDELVFEVPESEVEASKKVIRDIMFNAAHISVPLDVDVGVGHNWDEAH